MVSGSLIFYHNFWCVLQKILFGSWNGRILLAYNFTDFLDSSVLHGGSKASLDYEFQNIWHSKITSSIHLAYGWLDWGFILRDIPFSLEFLNEIHEFNLYFSFHSGLAPFHYWICIILFHIIVITSSLLLFREREMSYYISPLWAAGNILLEQSCLPFLQVVDILFLQMPEKIQPYYPFCIVCSPPPLFLLQILIIVSLNLNIISFFHFFNILLYQLFSLFLNIFIGV